MNFSKTIFMIHVLIILNTIALADHAPIGTQIHSAAMCVFLVGSTGSSEATRVVALSSWGAGPVNHYEGTTTLTINGQRVPFNANFTFTKTKKEIFQQFSGDLQIFAASSAFERQSSDHHSAHDYIEDALYPISGAKMIRTEWGAPSPAMAPVSIHSLCVPEVSELIRADTVYL